MRAHTTSVRESRTRILSLQTRAHFVRNKFPFVIAHTSACFKNKSGRVTLISFVLSWAGVNFVEIWFFKNLDQKSRFLCHCHASLNLSCDKEAGNIHIWSSHPVLNVVNKFSKFLIHLQNAKSRALFLHSFTLTAVIVYPYLADVLTVFCPKIQFSFQKAKER